MPVDDDGRRLTDADENNGCPWVSPGHHRQGTFQHEWTDLGWDCGIDDRGVSAPVRKGGVVVFSSLTPHMTGPNLTNQVRKTYIVQFAPDGAHIVKSESLTNDNDHLETTSCDDSQRQFVILKEGEVSERHE